MIRELRPHLPDLQTVCVLGSSGAPDTVSLDEMISGQHPLPPLVPQPLGANDVMRMAFTSGTTGNPKGVTHSCNTTLPACRILNDAMEVGEHEVFLVYLPLGLNWGYLTLLQAIMVGARAVLLDRFSARAALELIERERVTFIPSAPASLIAMLNDPELGRFDLPFAPGRDYGRGLLSGRDPPRLPGPDARALDRTLWHARDRLSHLHAPHG